MEPMVLWGHSISDYQEMFALTTAELQAGVLDVGAGAASFNAEAQTRGFNVVSVDTLYQLPLPVLREQVEQQFNNMLKLVEQNQEHFFWDGVGSFEALARQRKQGIETFFNDYEAGLKSQRYLPADLAKLPFPDFTFKVAVSSHYLFDYHANHSQDYTLAVITEMARVAEEVRIFPLIDHHTGKLSERVGPVLVALHQANFAVQVLQVPYQFEKNGNAMLSLRALTCQVTTPRIVA
jgi:SAM-dependent methyltransferase